LVLLVIGAHWFFDNKLSFIPLPSPSLPGGPTSAASDDHGMHDPLISIAIVGLVVVFLLTVYSHVQPGAIHYLSSKRPALFVGLFFLAAVGGWFLYDRSWRARTCEYEGSRYTIGDWMTEHGTKFKKEGMTDADLIAHHANHTEKVWPRKAIDAAREWLSVLYLAVVWLWGASLFLLAHWLGDAFLAKPLRPLLASIWVSAGP